MRSSLASPGSNSGFRELGEFLDHALVDGTLERNDQVREILHRLPAPADELGLVPATGGACDIDLVVLASEAYGVPFLSLTAIAALPGPPCDGARYVVDQPVRHFGDFLDRADAGFLIKLALGGFPGVLTGIDAALRHLPDMSFVDMLDAAGPATDEDEPGCVHQHHADTGSIGQVFVTRHSVRASRLA